MPRNTISIATTLLLIGCGTTPPQPSPEDLGNRIRVRVEGREVPSITTADYFLYLMVRGPDGTRKGVSILAPESSSGDGMALSIASRIESAFGIEYIELTEPVHGHADHCEDIVLPTGYTLCFEPGSHFAYRIIDHSRRMAADLAPEVTIGNITTDGSRYVEVEPSTGPELGRAKTPPGWPLE